MQRLPTVRKSPSGYVIFNPTDEARRAEAANLRRKPSFAQAPEKVRAEARQSAVAQGFKDPDLFTVRGFNRLQFGKYHGQTFHWLMEEDIGYATYIITRMEAEGGNIGDSPLNKHKHELKAYMEGFSDGCAALAQRRKEGDTRSQAKKKEMAKLVQSNLPSVEVARRLQKTPRPVVKPRMPSSATVSSIPTDDMEDEDLLRVVEALEGSEDFRAQAGRSKTAIRDVTPAPASQPQSKLETKTLGGKLKQADPDPLPRGWKAKLPVADHHWVSKALIRHNAQGKMEVQPQQLWYYPPQPSPVPAGPPTVNRYFTHPLLVWMPRKLWAIKLICLACDSELVAAGPHNVVREVLNLTSFYYLVTEELQCRRCTKRYLSWSQAVLKQLDIGHRSLFTVILTYRYACDISVITLLRTRTQGNSASQLRRKLVEEHSQDWMTRVLHYMSDCKSVIDSGLFPRLSVSEPPQQVAVPQAQWLQTVYCHDIMARVDDVKAAITSTFGKILKMDSTKKVTKKLAGQSRGTATWASDIGNEYGQVLMCVLTSREGYGLTEMVTGIINRYDSAGEDAPEVLYVDRDCCGDSEIFKMFCRWPDLKVRLDIWHFMRRFSAGCSTDAHILYPLFMSRLSKAIFEWNSEDLDLLKQAKRAELQMSQHDNTSDEDLCRWLTKYELGKYCRRRTRGVAETTRLIGELIGAFMGDEGKDTSGVPLFDNEVMTAIWDRQRRHIECIQDPEGVSLYTITGTAKKGGVELTKFRCARGSVSLESFHNHLAKFIPGTTASDAHFQAYLLDGLVRWNQDREKDCGANYSGSLQHAVNKLSMELLQRNLVPDFKVPRAYTGEKIGLEYLYAQNNSILLSLDPDNAEVAAVEPGPADESSDAEGDDVDEGFEEDNDATIPPLPQVIQPTPRRVSVQAASPVEPVVAPVPAPPRPTLPLPTGDKQSEQLDPEDTRGPENVGGYQLVENLSEYLFSLRDQQKALSNAQADAIVHLWQQLTPFDQQPTTPQPRHRIRHVSVSTATYKRKGAQNVVPGVDTVNRTMRGDSEGPAQKPDSNRIMANLIVKLCTANPSPEKRGGQRIERWSLVTRAYRNIRRLLLDNDRVLAETRLQLFNINNATLAQWYNDRIKTQELAILKQGLTAPEPPMAATTGVFPEPVVRVPVSEQPPVPVHQQHQFDSMPIQVGQATVRKRLFPPSESPAIPESTCRGQSPPLIATPLHLSSPGPSLSKTTQWYHKQVEKKIKQGKQVKQYTRQRSQHTYTCSKCGEIRNPPEHTQYYGSWFCARTSTQTFEEWRTERIQQRELKKQKKS